MRISQLTRRAIDPVVDILFPPGCWAGGAGDAMFGLSDAARMEIASLAAQPFCTRCGLTIGLHAAQDPCARCGLREVATVRFARVGTFSEPLIGLVHRLKFGRSWEIARVLAPFLYHAMTAVTEKSGAKVDLLVPVPLHWRRQASRGFNQSQELAREVSKLARWESADILRRSRHTREQARMESVPQRLDNLRGAFTCRRTAGKRAAGKHVWIIDDVSTTGATLCAAAKALHKLPRHQRPASINAAVLCVTDLNSPPAPDAS